MATKFSLNKLVRNIDLKTTTDEGLNEILVGLYSERLTMSEEDWTDIYSLTTKLVHAETDRRQDILDRQAEKKAERKAKILAAGGTWHEQPLDK